MICVYHNEVPSTKHQAKRRDILHREYDCVHNHFIKVKKKTKDPVNKDLFSAFDYLGGISAYYSIRFNV